MNTLSSFFIPCKGLTKDSIAALLQTNREALDAFERSYQTYAIDAESDHFFQQNSRQAAERNHVRNSVSEEALSDTRQLQERIVNELLAQTEVYCYNGDRVTFHKRTALPDRSIVTLDEINSLPLSVRPQLSGNLMKRDIKEDSSSILLWEYREYIMAQDPIQKKRMYQLFRQGLDVLDLDALTYAIIGTNPNSMSHWLPQLVKANQGVGFFKIPKTTIAKVPIPLLQLTRQEYSDLTPTTLSIVDQWAYRAFCLSEGQEYFIKTGTYSSKFDFRNTHVKGEKETRELGEYLLYIHFQALQMAGPLTQPHPIYGVSTTNEWVVREWIPDRENNPCIYKGCPLHTEYRVFIDCDRKEILGVTPYWEPETMKRRFCDGTDADSPHQIHDYIVYSLHENTIMRRYNDHISAVIAAVEELLPGLDLHGQWSLDIMQNGEDFWLIDMAMAQNSAFYEVCVPADRRLPSQENWLPQLPKEGTR